MAANETSFKPGHKKIEGSGARAGQKRRSTEMVNRLFDYFEKDEIRQSLVMAWKGLNEKEKWDVYVKCMKFMAPTITSVSFEDNAAVSSIQQLVMNMAAYKKDK